MALKRSFFSRLFGSSSAQEETAEESAEEQRQVLPEEPPPLPDNSFLEIPPDHIINRLVSLRTEQAGSAPPPEFHMMADGELLPRAELDRELERLKRSITTTAGKRLEKALPRVRPAADPEAEPEPGPVLDAQAVVFIPYNQLTAWLYVYPPVGGGAELNRGIISQALDEAGVHYGVDNALLDGLPDKEARYFRLYLAASGIAPAHGKDGSIVDLFPRKVEREYKVDEKGQVDYTTLNIVQNVEAGAVICRIIPPTEGVDGHSVTDQVLTAKNGRAASAPRGRNTTISEDGTALVATRAGHVEFTGRTFEIKPMLEIGGNVACSTGNINFLGDVHIHGDVCSGFTVRAMGSITVDGVVEASSVEAGGDLIVAKGVQGNEQAVIRSQRNIFVKYLENCSVYARGNLQADCIINCEVYSDGVVQVRSGRGTIIGGRICAAREVSASTIGSKSELFTTINLGGSPCEDFERELLEKELKELMAELDRVMLQPESPDKLRQLSTLRMKISVNRNKQNLFEKNAEKEKGGEGQEEAPKTGRLQFSIAYPGTEIVIGDAVLRLNHETWESTASLVDGEVRIS